MCPKHSVAVGVAKECDLVKTWMLCPKPLPLWTNPRNVIPHLAQMAQLRVSQRCERDNARK